MIFGKKKNVDISPVEDIPPLPTLESLQQGHQENHEPVNMPSVPQMPANHIPQPQPKISPQVKPREMPKQEEKKMEAERPAFAPLFVKIDRYRNILNSLGQLRTSVAMIRNSFATLNELEKARIETLKLIEEAVGRVDNKLASLDSELLKPTGHHVDLSPEYRDVEAVNATVADLKGQIEQLRTELEHLA